MPSSSSTSFFSYPTLGMAICLVVPSRLMFITAPPFSARYSNALRLRVRPFSPLALLILLASMEVILLSLASSRASSSRPSCSAMLPLAPEIYRPFLPLSSLKEMVPSSLAVALMRSLAASELPLLKIIFSSASFWLMSSASTSTSCTSFSSTPWSLASLVRMSFMASTSADSLKLMLTVLVP